MVLEILEKWHSCYFQMLQKWGSIEALAFARNRFSWDRRKALPERRSVVLEILEKWQECY